MAADGGSGHEPFEHTADVGLRVWAPGMREIFQEAAEGFIEMLVDPGTVEPREQVEISAEAEEEDELLVAWLEEILFTFEARQFAPGQVEVTSFGKGRVGGLLRGEPLDTDRHETRRPVKAVTYHDLKIERADDRCEVRIVFDV